jgi:hypothetical protein
MKFCISLLALTAFLVFAALQLNAGYAGIQQAIGPMWAFAALLSAVFLRFTLPITVGAFFGAMTVWGWHWPFAFMFCAPGLVFALPGVIPAIFSLATTGSAKLTRATPVCAEH